MTKLLSLSFKNRIAFNYFFSGSLLIVLVFFIIYSVLKYNVDEHINEEISVELNYHLSNVEIINNQIKQIENTLKLTDAETKRHDALQKAKEEQEAMELYVKLVDPKTGKYTEKEMQAMSEKDIVEVVDAEGYKGSEAKKLASELVKIAKG